MLRRVLLHVLTPMCGGVANGDRTCMLLSLLRFAVFVVGIAVAAVFVAVAAVALLAGVKVVKHNALDGHTHLPEALHAFLQLTRRRNSCPGH